MSLQDMSNKISRRKVLYLGAGRSADTTLPALFTYPSRIDAGSDGLDHRLLRNHAAKSEVEILPGLRIKFADTIESFQLPNRLPF
jgi:hypothetical protein